MLNYVIRRLLYAIPILLGVNLLTFALFFMVNTPDDMARIHLGAKHVTPESIARWKSEHGYDKPLFFNTEARRAWQGRRIPCSWRSPSSCSCWILAPRTTGRDIAHEIRPAHVAQPGHRGAHLPGGPADLHQLGAACWCSSAARTLDLTGVVILWWP
jgi:hypothetical protein